MSFKRGQVFEDSDDEGPSWGDQKQAEETASRSASLIGGTDDRTNVQVRFVTKLPEHMRVSQDPIALPATLTRFALSEIINHLLALAPPRRFDFIIGDEFLRSSLEDFLKRRSDVEVGEGVVQVEYVEATPKPEQQSDYEHEDWISSICSAPLKSESTRYFLTGSYDNRIRLWDSNSGDCVLEIEGHTQPVLSLAVAHNPKQHLVTKDGKHSFDLVSASQDHSLRSFEVNAFGKKSARAKDVYKGHLDTVSSVSIDPTAYRFCSSSWDKTVKVWELYPEPKDEEEEEVERSNKRQKSGVKTPLTSFNGHAQPVTAVDWSEEETIMSASQDHTLRVWDVESGVATGVLSTNQAFNAISVSTFNGLVVSSHSDKSIRLLDPRSKEGEVVKRTFTSHRQWVTSVKWHPSSSNVFASCSRDGTAKLWDIRSKIALYTLLPPEASSTEKKSLIPLLAVCWKGQDTLLSGGCNKTVRSHLVKVPSDLPNITASTSTSPTPSSSSSPSSTTTATTKQTQISAKKPANKKQT